MQGSWGKKGKLGAEGEGWGSAGELGAVQGSWGQKGKVGVVQESLQRSAQPHSTTCKPVSVAI